MNQQQTNEKLCLRVPAERSKEGEIRSSARAWLRDRNVPEDQAVDVLLAMGEMFSNAVDATSTSADVTVRLSMMIDAVTVKVFNVGPPFRVDTQQREAECERGRGLGIVSALGAMKVRCAGGRTVVTCELPATRYQRWRT